MSDRTAPPGANGKPGAAVIRRTEAAEETSQERLVKKHVPAWVVSGAVHVAVIALLILILGPRDADTKPSEKTITTTAAKTQEEEDKPLTNEDIGLDANTEAALDVEKVDAITSEGVITEDPSGRPDSPTTDINSANLPGITAADATGGVSGDTGAFATGAGGSNGSSFSAVDGRSGSTKTRLVKSGGGSERSEAAVARGLGWLAKQQKSDGSWEYEQGGHKAEKIAATGMALLPFLAAGCTHKPSKDGEANKHLEVVKKGLEYLKRNCPISGPAAGRMSTNMYAQAIGAIPLCEAYGMTKDGALLPHAQAAINFIQNAQGPNGSWGYGPKTNGDTSIVGWQVQALQAAKLAKGMVVSDAVLKKAIGFLNLAGGGSRKSMYGYADATGARPGTALTAVGLLCRYYIDGWGPNHPGMVDGMGGLMKHGPRGKGEVGDMYYYYYATQVAHFCEGEEWKTWNEGPKGADGVRKGGMRDWLVDTQVGKAGPNFGSWDPEAGTIGNECGRLGTTAMCLLTLEVYYRHLPLYKRGADGKAEALIDK